MQNENIEASITKGTYSKTGDFIIEVQDPLEDDVWRVFGANRYDTLGEALFAFSANVLNGETGMRVTCGCRVFASN